MSEVAGGSSGGTVRRRVADRGLVAVLGSMDPEMERIAALLRRHGYWLEMADPREPYDCTVSLPRGVREVLLVECGPCLRDDKGDPLPGEADGGPPVTLVDHHNPGDPGYGRPPAEFWEASSLGQVHALLGVEPDEEAIYVAAGDHCLRAAYAGECPGVDPDRLLSYRLRDRLRHAKRQGRDVSMASLRSDLRRTLEGIRSAPVVRVGGSAFRDMRGRTWPLLPEVSARAGVNVLYSVPDARGGVKFGAFGDPDAVRAWLDWVRPVASRVWGDPMRGFAGALGVDARHEAASLGG